MYKRRCRKVCWGVGEVREDVRKGVRSEVKEEIWGSVLGPHTLTHFPTPSLSSPHTPTPHVNTLPHSPHTLSTPIPTHLSLSPPHFPTPPPYLFPHLPSPPLHPNTLPHSPHTLSHIFPHSFNYVAKLQCYWYLTYFNWKIPIKFFTTTANFKSFGLGNVNF